MFGLGYFRPHSATDYVAKFVNGAKRSEGRGKSFIYGPRTTLARIPTTEQVVTFMFREITNDGQALVVNGNCYVRLDPAKLLSRYDFTINPATNAYIDADSLERLKVEIRSRLQTYVRLAVQAGNLQSHMADTANLEKQIVSSVVTGNQIFVDLGLLEIRVLVSGIEPGNKDLQKALEAKKREELLAGADKAQADRHMASAQSLRELKQYEAATALTLESEREKLIAVQNENLLKEAAAQAEANTKKLEVYKTLEPGKLFALALQDMANHGNVGTVNLTSDLLSAIQGATDHR